MKKLSEFLYFKKYKSTSAGLPYNQCLLNTSTQFELCNFFFMRLNRGYAPTSRCSKLSSTLTKQKACQKMRFELF